MVADNSGRQDAAGCQDAAGERGADVNDLPTCQNGRKIPATHALHLIHFRFLPESQSPIRSNSFFCYTLYTYYINTKIPLMHEIVRPHTYTHYSFQGGLD